MENTQSINQSQALVPQILLKIDRKIVGEVISFLAGVFLISALAQVAIPLPWTPVPITGQTLGVTLVALTWGWRRALGVVLGYLALGGLGFPIFAMAKSGLSVGPTLGYLVGMAISSLVVGALADRGFAQTFKKALAAAFVGSFVVFACGLFGLSFFLPKETLFAAGLLPFLPGDLIKNVIAAWLAPKAKSSLMK